MPLEHLRFGRGFHVACSNARGQAATMALAPGDSEGGYVLPAYTSAGGERPRGEP